jgi:hypothetical protein
LATRHAVTTVDRSTPYCSAASLWVARPSAPKRRSRTFAGRQPSPLPLPNHSCSRHGYRPPTGSGTPSMAG